MRILLTNHRLDDRGGSDMYLRDVAAALLRRGHQPMAYSPFLGLAAEDLRRAGVPVVRDLSLVHEPPDLIHGQHHLPTVEALLRFPGVPAVFFCHGWLPWQEMPPRLSRITRYVCVSALTRERLVTEEGIPSDLVEVIPNFVDLDRFQPRSQPLPQKPQRALVFSNNAVPGEGFHAAIATACAERGIQVDTLGLHSGRVPLPPEQVLADYDIVFARGRAAMEAMAVGCSVILCDTEGLGPSVTLDAVEHLAAGNFGFTTLTDGPTVDLIRDRLDDYQPREATEVQAWLRANAGLEAAVDRIEKVYRDCLTDWSTGTSVGSDDAAELASYLRLLQTVTIPQLVSEIQVAGAREGTRSIAERVRVKFEIADLKTQLASASERLAAEQARSVESGQRVRELESQLAGLNASRAIRVRNWLARHPTLAASYRSLARLFGLNRRSR